MQSTTFQSDLRSRRAAAGLRLIDVAVGAGCAPQTVRCFEAGLPVRPQIAARLRAYYDALPDEQPKSGEGPHAA